MAKRAARPSVLSEGSFGAFVLDQLSGLSGVEARPMFGGAGFYLDGKFFGILYEEQLYFRVSAGDHRRVHDAEDETVHALRRQARQSRGYYEVPVEILESPGDLVNGRRGKRTPPLSSTKK